VGEITKDNDCVIGCITNYNFKKIEPWVNSLVRSGFSGKKIMVVTDSVDPEAIEILQKLNFDVIRVNSNHASFNIVVDRFNWLWNIIESLKSSGWKFRYIIAPDVADVVFQRDPSVWLEQNMLDKKLCVGSESLKYVDEPWGFNNMRLSFGDFILQNRMLNSTIYNAGTIAGDATAISELSYNIYLSTGRSPAHVPGGGGPDQAALNLLLSFNSYSDITKFNDHDDSWACQCGTTVDPNKISTFRQKLLSPEPVFDGEYVYTSKGEKYVLVHQYNRVPAWKQLIEKKYS
jgi:hypothetical protein